MQLSKELNTHMIGTIVEKGKNNLYIAAIIVGPNVFLGKHKKDT